MNARESAGQPESQAVTWTQISQEEAGAGSGLSLSLPWCRWDGQMLPGVRRHVRCGPSHMGFDVILFTIRSYPTHLCHPWQAARVGARPPFLLPCRPPLRAELCSQHQGQCGEGAGGARKGRRSDTALITHRDSYYSHLITVLSEWRDSTSVQASSDVHNAEEK